MSLSSSDSGDSSDTVARGVGLIDAAARPDGPGVAALAEVENIEIMAAAWAEDPIAVQAAFLRLRSRKGGTLVARELGPLVKQRAGELAPPDVSDADDIIRRAVQPTVGDCIAGAPSDIADFAVPFGYDLNARGVWQVGAEGRRSRLATAPILPSARSEDVVTRKRTMTLSWLQPGLQSSTWQTSSIPREVACDPRAIVSLAGDGAPVTGPTSRGLVTWLSAFEACNELPIDYIVSRMGWTAMGFQAGATTIGGEPCRLIPPLGMARLAASVGPRGSAGEWAELAGAAMDYPMAALCIYASIASILLPILGAPCFILDLSGITSGGKTTSIRLGISVWADPSDDGGYIGSWSDTDDKIEKTAGFLHHLPLVRDDTKTIRDPDIAARSVYQFSQGHGRGKGGLATTVSDTPEWRSVMFSSGESSLAGKTQDAGAKARVVALSGKPLGTNEKVGRDLAVRLERGLALHHGHLGPAVVAWLLDTRDEWPRLVADYAERTALIAARCPGAVSGRLASHLAALDIARMIVHEVPIVPKGRGRLQVCLRKPEHHNAAIDLAIAAVAAANASADHARESYDDLMGWVVGNPSRFIGVGGRQPLDGGWVGAWTRDDEFIYIRRVPLFTLLREWKYVPEEIVERWRERGVLVLSTKNRGLVRKNGMACYQIRLNWKEEGE